MAANFTLGQAKLDARLFADQRAGSQLFISDVEATRLVNLKRRELIDLLVSARGAEYYAAEALVSIVAGTSRYDLPADFYQLDSVTLEWNSQEHEVVSPVQSSAERARYTVQPITWSQWDAKGYRLRNNQIEFLPTPNRDVDCRLQYVPVLADLVDDADTFDGINGFEKMIAIGVAIEMMAIEKRASAALNGLYAEQLARIDTMKTERDAEASNEVIDVDPLGRRGRRPWYAPTFDGTFDPTFW